MSSPLPRSTPADQGVASAGVTGFLDVLDAAADVELHSVMLLRHGQVVAEGWWAPYSAEQPHLLYSLSKSFTATAAGLAAAEALIGFDELVVGHVPELVDDAVGPRARALRVGQLAAMATGHTTDTLDRAFALDPAEPVRGFLHLEPEAEPGSVFCYNNGATYVLGALVQRLSGQSLTGFLRPRLLDPLGIAPAFWHTRPPGRELGFSGLHLTTEDIARFGQLYLDDGVWRGTRLLPEGWVGEATRLHTPNPAEPNPDWQQGYGFQFWRSRHGYRGDGAYGQFCLVLPEQDTVLVITAQTENMQAVLDAVWAHLLPAVGTATPEQDEALATRLARGQLPATDPTAFSAEPAATAAGIGVTGVAEDGEEGWLVRLTDGEEEIAFHAGKQRWRTTDLVLTDGRRLVLSAAATAGPAAVTVQVVFTQTPHRLVVTVTRPDGPGHARWQTGPLHAPRFGALALGAGG